MAKLLHQSFCKWVWEVLCEPFVGVQVLAGRLCGVFGAHFSKKTGKNQKALPFT